MKSKLSTISKLAMAIVILFVFTQKAQCQDEQELLNQLTGKAESPNRNTEQLTEAYQKAIDYLLPLMSAEDVGSRYNPQILFQDLGSYASRPGAETERQTLAKVMIKNLEEKEMPDTVRNWFVLQIQRIGEGESVPALTKLLSPQDKHLRDYARRALEKNPDPSATDVLLKELEAGKEPTWKVGLINSLGQRKAVSAVPTIINALGDPEQKVAATAVAALSNIANQAAIEALSEIINKPASPIYLNAARGLINIAQAKASNNQITEAGNIFDAIYENTSKNTTGPDTTSIRAAAINGVISCNPEKGAALIVNIIKDDNPKIRSAAVMGARLSPSDAPAQALGKILADLEPDTQVQVLGLIGDRRDLSSINQVEKMLQSDNEQVRLSSIDTMSKLGDATAAKVLFDIAVNGAGAEKETAHLGLVTMMGTNIEILINSNSSSGSVPSKVEAIKLIGERQMTDSSEKLLEFAAEDNEQISTAAFSALANVADASSVPALVSLIAQTKSDNARNSGITTLKSILTKVEDKNKAAQSVIDQIKKSSEQTKLSLLTSLNALGGSRALATVVDAAQSSDEETCNAGIRTLCDWPDYEAATFLLDIASKSETSLSHYVLAIRGILRLIQENDSFPMKERAALCLSAFNAARRDEEKRQIISTMATLPIMEVAEKLMEISKDNNLKAEAGLAVVQLASNMLSTDRQAAQSLAQKILDMNISEDINRRAQSVISGRTFRGRGGFGGMNFMRGPGGQGRGATRGQ